MNKFAILFLLIQINVFSQKKLEIYFDFNKSDINILSKIKLDSLLKINNSIEIIKIDGFCDKIDTHKYNDSLSLARAKMVMNYFKSLDINFANNFKINAFGKKFNHDIEQYKNRKVNIYFTELNILNSKNKKEFTSLSQNDIEKSKNEKTNISLLENDIEKSKNEKTNISLSENDIEKSKNEKTNISLSENDIEKSKNEKTDISLLENDTEKSKNEKINFSLLENDTEKSKNKKTNIISPENDLKDKINNAKKGDFIKLKNINFVNNSDEILPKSMRTLIELFKILQENEYLSIEIQGHICCKTPTEEDLISEARAKAIYNFLVKNKIDKNRLKYKGFGVSRPIFEIPEKNELEQEQNRRVEILILDN